MTSENDNGHNLLTTEEQQDLAETAEALNGLTSGTDSMPFQQKLGVLQRVITAVGTDKDYRQILLLAAFDNKKEALLTADAIAERLRYGGSIQPILDRTIALCSVKGENRVDKVLHALTHYTLNTNSSGGKMPFWKKKQENSGLS